MSLGKFPLFKKFLNLVRKIKQAQRIGNGGAAAAQLGREIFLGGAEIFLQDRIGPGSVDWVQVFPTEVFDKCELERLPVVCLADDSGNLLETRQLRRAPAALSGDQLVLLSMAANHHRLHQTDCLYRFCKLCKSIVVEYGSRLLGVADDLTCLLYT